MSIKISKNRLDMGLTRLIKATVIYYISSAGGNPVSVFLDSLNSIQQAKLLRIIKYAEIYGLQSILPHVKKLSATPLWEIRVLGKNNIRALYAVVRNNSIIILHGFVKKTQKTPPREVNLALSRLKEWLKNNP